ncbi:Undecaprenyl phosphate-alpha-4-amino-4-deoxy-L-arabinose arabinosyl transferase 2 [Halomicronema hongdechloris C2206]|uniref:Undecaprenyl phosphate-alpha-4-amino-4-deoxy-L-arabinose arabinosyl transferase 2 n=1 Tax=Halomicronema hongdechloris C2206 TaxID=1641165 RepID=A0A1Z3HUD7_9CYAN|nr:glycosyltransferase family 39 protein [Halomicronema hongdechloris]ASC73924.1 Undecaprenyl phosphate-alpha-4-amino-4-deoxy-L-arabinose arabinosyl transferase 2 [Halomicronema hongdechloris C2206]
MASRSKSSPIFPWLKRWLSVPTLIVGASILWVLLISWVAFGWQLGSTGLVDETEPLFAEAARQMYASGDWITPYFNGDPRFDKPPLVYWGMALGFHLWGVTEWTVRLPSALAAFALTGFGFYSLRRFGVPRPQPLASDTSRSGQSQAALWTSAFIGAAVLAFNPETIAWARTGVSDMLLAATMGAALLAFFLAYAQPQTPQRQTAWYLAAYGFAALAVLTKGPVGIVLPGLVVLVFLAYTGQLSLLWREMRLGPGVLLFLVITIPWYVLVIQANGQAYIESFFGYHNVERFTQVVNDHAAPWYFYFVVVAVGFLPWSPFLPYAIARLQPWRRRFWQRQPRTSHLGLFALIWFAVIFGFFTIAVTKLPSYVLPLMPAAAILVGLAWGDALLHTPSLRPMGWGFRVSVILNLVLFIGLGAAALYSPNWIGNDPAMPNLPERLSQSGILAHAAIIWGLAALAGLVLIIRRHSPWLWSINLIAFVAFLTISILPAYGLIDTARQAPLRQLAHIIQTQATNTEPVIMMGFKKPSLVFYSQRPVTYIYAADAVDQHLHRLTAPSIWLVGRRQEIAQLTFQTYQPTETISQGTYQLVKLTCPDITQDIS